MRDDYNQLMRLVTRQKEMAQKHASLENDIKGLTAKLAKGALLTAAAPCTSLPGPVPAHCHSAVAG